MSRRSRPQQSVPMCNSLLYHPAGSDREGVSVRTISVSSSAAAARNDTVVVRVYHLANGRRITQYSNIPQATPGRAGQPARVHVVPAEDATQAYAYAPR